MKTWFQHSVQKTNTAKKTTKVKCVIITAVVLQQKKSLEIQKKQNGKMCDCVVIICFCFCAKKKENENEKLIKQNH